MKGTQTCEVKLEQLEVGAPEWWEVIREKHDIGWNHSAGLDHERSYGDVFICSPYGITGSTLMPLLQACADEGLIVQFCGHSIHNPGATFTMGIFRPQDESVYWEFIHGCDQALEREALDEEESVPA